MIKFFDRLRTQKAEREKRCDFVVQGIAESAARAGWKVDEILPRRRQFREPSRTIPEHFARMAMSYDAWIADHDVTRTSGEKRWAKQYIDELYSVSSKSFPPVLDVRLSDVEVESLHGCIRTSAGVIVKEASLVDPQVAARGFGGSMEQIDEGFLLFGSWPLNYAHWLMDSLPRLAAVGFDPGTEHVLLPHRATPFHWGALEVLGISGGRALQAPCASVRSLRFVRAASRTGYPRVELLSRLRERFRERLPAVGAANRIYVSRSRATRRVINEDDVFESFRELGFEKVCCEDLTFREQWELFGNAEVVAGPHGAGIYNLVFARPGAKVIEFYHPQRWDSAAARIASLLGFEHWHLFGEPAGGTFDMTLDRKAVDRLLEAALR